MTPTNPDKYWCFIDNKIQYYVCDRLAHEVAKAVAEDFNSLWLFQVSDYVIDTEDNTFIKCRRMLDDVMHASFSVVDIPIEPPVES